ncbi:MAG: hypothetical protein H0X66_14410 [Verrucomicrobia bacterium]|nr:hypothetical protein [Verrucomicrobiota bacterium]
MTIQNTNPLRLDCEAVGLALMQSGSYVRTTLDKEELDRLKAFDFRKLEFRREPSVIVVHGSGKRGLLARLAYLSKDGEYLRYPDRQFPARPAKYLSVILLKAEVFKDWRDFLKVVISQPESRHLCLKSEFGHPNQRNRFGILYGSDEKYYSSLVYLVENELDHFKTGFGLLDVEPTSNALNEANRTQVLEKNPPGAETLRQKLASL